MVGGIYSTCYSSCSFVSEFDKGKSKKVLFFSNKEPVFFYKYIYVFQPKKNHMLYLHQ